MFNTVKENGGRGMAGCVVSHLGFTIANVCISQQYQTSVTVMFSVRSKASEFQKGKDGDTQFSLLRSQSSLGFLHLVSWDVEFPEREECFRTV